MIEDLRTIHGEGILFRTPVFQSPSERIRTRRSESNPAHQSIEIPVEEFSRDLERPHLLTPSRTSPSSRGASPGGETSFKSSASQEEETQFHGHSATRRPPFSPPFHFGRHIPEPVTPIHQHFPLEEVSPESTHNSSTPKPEPESQNSRASASLPPVYPAHDFDIHRGSRNPLSLAPVAGKGHRISSSSPDITAEYDKETTSRTRPKAGTFSFSRSFGRRSLESSPEAAQTGTKRKRKLKQAPSAILKKIFQSGSRKNSDEHTYLGVDTLVDGAAFATPCVNSEKGKEPIRDPPVCERHTSHSEVNQLEEQPTPRTVHRQTSFRWPSILHSRVRSKSALIVSPEKTTLAAEKDLQADEDLETISAVPTIEIQAVVENPHVTQKLSPEAHSTAFQEHLSNSKTSPSHSFTMELPRASRFLDPSSAMASITKQKVEAIKLAKEQAAAVKEMCRRAKSEVPPYEFEELIGKGAYGRVYKGRQIPSRDVVAIKVMEIDSVDYKTIRDMKDESIKDFTHEIKVMNQAKESGAKNINMLIEAISIHSQLWVVSEYCPGGSVKTLVSSSFFVCSTFFCSFVIVRMSTHCLVVKHIASLPATCAPHLLLVYSLLDLPPLDFFLPPYTLSQCPTYTHSYTPLPTFIYIYSTFTC